jgi:hypothetical protein
VVQGQPRQIVHETPLQNNQSIKMDRRCGSSSITPALRPPDLQAEVLSLNPSSTKKKKENL